MSIDEWGSTLIVYKWASRKAGHEQKWMRMRIQDCWSCNGSQHVLRALKAGIIISRTDLKKFEQLQTCCYAFINPRMPVQKQSSWQLHGLWILMNKLFTAKRAAGCFDCPIFLATPLHRMADMLYTYTFLLVWRVNCFPISRICWLPNLTQFSKPLSFSVKPFQKKLIDWLHDWWKRQSKFHCSFDK